MISGSLPPEPCGVGDYTEYLAKSLQAQQVELQLQRLGSLSLKHIRRLCQQSILHIQYPSRGYGKSLFPQLLSILCKPVVVTLHEFSQAHFLRKLADLPFLLFADKIIVITEFEKASLCALYSGFCKKVVVIPISVNFLPQHKVPDLSQRTGVAFFGLMREEKGVELFIQLAKLIQENGKNIPVHIFSAVPKDCEKYFAVIKNMAIGLDIHWHINCPLSEVSKGLLQCKYAYLYYPDGVSERRSSFMGVVAHGLIILSNSTSTTADFLKPAFVEVEMAQIAFDTILCFEADTKAAQRQQQHTIDVFTQNYSASKVADEHIAVYSQVLQDK